MARMIRGGRCCRLFLCGVLAFSTVVAFAQTPPPNSSQSAIASVFIVVRSKNGNNVPNLRAEDLTVLDNGHPVKVLDLQPAQDIPVRLGIVLVSGSGNFTTQKHIAIDLLQSLRPGIDQAFVLTGTELSLYQPWPTKDLGWSTDPGALISFASSLHEDQALPSAHKAVMSMLALDPKKPFRRVLLEFWDPELDAGGDGSWLVKREARLQTEIAEYQRRNAVVYTSSIPGKSPIVDCSVLPRSPDRGACNEQHSGPSAERLAISTGGRYLSWNKLQSDIASINQDLQNQMVLTFASEADPQQKPHTLEVRANRKDVHVTSPNAFYPEK